MKVVILMRGPGEVSQGYAMGKYMLNKGDEVFFVLMNQINETFLPDKESLHITVLSDQSFDLDIQFVDFVNKINPDAVILCNSKSFSNSEKFISSPWPSIPVFTLDSNWLFNEKYERLRYCKWAEKFFINIPQAIFDYGLAQNGGDFDIDKSAVDKLQIVGLIPSYLKLERHIVDQWRREHGVEDQKIIFCYVSGQGAGVQTWVLDNLIATTEPLIHKGNKIHIFIAGKIEDAQKPELSWCTYLGSDLNIESYYLALSSSHLVFQHQGLATLTQAICAQVPTIANVTDYPKSSIPKIHTFEVAPFEKSGVCKMFHKNSDLKIISKAVESLLYDDDERLKMIRHQKDCFNRGEELVYDSILKIVSHST